MAEVTVRVVLRPRHSTGLAATTLSVPTGRTSMARLTESDKQPKADTFFSDTNCAPAVLAHCTVTVAVPCPAVMVPPFTRQR